MVQGEKARYEHLPIPTYEEATSSSQTHRGAEEISDDAERQGLLGGGGATRRNGPYQAPTVESTRSSEDSDLYLPEVTGAEAEEDAALRRSMEQMDILEPDAPGQRRSRIRHPFTKPFAHISHTLSNLHIPSLRQLRLPSFSSLASSFPTIPDEYRMGLPVFARLVGLFIIAALIYVLFALDIIPSRGHMAQHYDPESVRARVQAEVDTTRIADYLRYITAFDHVAGTEGDLYLARWIQDMWSTADMDQVAMQSYYVYLDYPTVHGRRVAIVDPPELTWEAKLEEEPAYSDTGRLKQQTLAWHGNSRNGNVTGPLVYANGGSREDFQKLKDMGVNLNGSIALVRYYHTQADRALKIKAAELAGAAGCIIYSDPMEDGFLRGQPLPDGPWRPSDSVQRGGVSLTSWVVGDVLSPGWASTAKSHRISEFDNPGLPNIPSLPLAWRDAQRLLQVIKGHGQKVPDDWVGGVPDVDEWWTGDASSPTVNLMNENDQNKMQQIWNVHGTIQGMETTSKKIIIGNHRDSWCYGSVDPGSGTAVMMEVVSIFGTLRKLGWRPLRTIEFVSWDAEEYNLIGSTEFVEEYIDSLREDGVAYLNVDVGVFGPVFHAAASPLFVKPLLHVLDRVSDPVRNVTLRQIWDESHSQLEGLGAGGDYVAFQDMVGTSSIDFGFKGPENGYPYHSCYETYEWMERFGDPDLKYHGALAQIWALLILELADRPIIPYDLSAYASAITTYVNDLEADAETTAHLMDSDAGALGFNVQPLRQAVELFTNNAVEFHAFDDFWTSQVLGGAGGFESNGFALKRIEHNSRLCDFETDLLDIPATGESAPHGVPGREQYKHIIFGPQAWSGYEEAFFPAVRDALDARNFTGAQIYVERAARILGKAAAKLVG